MNNIYSGGTSNIPTGAVAENGLNTLTVNGLSMSDQDNIPEGRILPRIEQILQCPMCLDRFEDPKLLPCGHTFCRSCLECRSRAHHVTCPIDNRKHALPMEGIAGMPGNVTASTLSDVVFSTSSNVPKYCCSDCGDVCEELKRCFNHCSGMVCSSCLDCHTDGAVREAEVILKDIRKQIEMLDDACGRWERKHLVLLNSYDEARAELDNVFKACFQKLREKHIERQNALEEMVRPHYDAFRTKLCKAKECKAKAEEMCTDLEKRLKKPDTIREVELFCIRLKCIQQMALLDEFVTASQEEGDVSGIEWVKIELDESWMNFCIGKLFRKSIVSRLA